MRMQEAIAQELRKDWRFRYLEKEDPDGVMSVINDSMMVAKSIKVGTHKPTMFKLKHKLRKSLTEKKPIKTGSFVGSIIIGVVVRLIVDYIFKKIKGV